MQKTAFYSPAYSAGWQISKYSLLARLYFFFNSVFLPKGLLYTNILSPVFFYNVVRARRKTYLLHFAIFLGFYDIIHLYNGVDVVSFLISNALFVSTYFCVIAFYHFVNNYEGLTRLFRQVLVFNAALAVLAIPFFFMPRHYQEWFWYINKLTKGIADFPRLALFTYEASYYSLLLVPIFYYYVLKFIFNAITQHKWLTLALATVPMLMSLSFGVLGVTVLTALVMVFVFWKKLLKKKRSFVLVFSLVGILLTGVVILVLYFPDNALFIRMANVAEGKDTSANGRIVDSFTMAWRIVNMKTVFFGVGLGQIKIMILELVHKYYKYWGEFERYDIPNAMGEALAIFGITGVALKLFLEFYLFAKTKVATNYYRLALFIFIFIYQFTGSFITNIVEYVIWILAFSNVFRVFDVSQKKEV